MVNSATLDTVATPARSSGTVLAKRRDDAAFRTLLDRLSKLSVEKGADAYADVDWAGLGPVEVDDPRNILPPGVDPFCDTEWYRGLPQHEQARFGLVRMASCLTTGWHFENLLQQGLLHRALWLPDGSDEFRYVHHEIIEESHHTQMFHEFVRLAGVPVRGMPRWLRVVVELFVGPAAHRDPLGFFLLVLGGEDPVDHLQRRILATDAGHPLLRQIMRIHIAEEARHISFARAALVREAARAGRVRRRAFAISAAVALGIMVRMMVAPTSDMVRAGAPREVVRQSFRTPAGRELLAACASKPRQLLRELDLITPESRLVWKAFGIWAED